MPNGERYKLTDYGIERYAYKDYTFTNCRTIYNVFEMKDSRLLKRNHFYNKRLSDQQGTEYLFYNSLLSAVVDKHGNHLLFEYYKDTDEYYMIITDTAERKLKFKKPL